MEVLDVIVDPDWVDKEQFIQDRQNGMTARQLQKKYTLTPRQYRRLCVEIWGKQKKQIFGKDTYYIRCTEYGKYCVCKRVEDKQKTWGGFQDMESAIEFRNRMIECGWNIEKADEIKEEIHNKGGFNAR